MSARLAFLLAMFASTHTLWAQSGRIDSLSAVVPSMPDDSSKVAVLRELAYHHIFNDSKRAWSIIGEAEALSRRLELLHSHTDVIRLKAIYFDVTGALDSAYFYFSEGHRLSVERNFPALTVKMLNGLGMNAWNSGKDTEALKFFFDVLETNKKLPAGSQISESIPFNNIGLIYQEQGMYEKALEYHYKALDLRLADDALLVHASTSYNNIGICLTHLERYEEAEAEFRRGISLARERRYLRQYFDLIANLANTLQKVGRFDEAISLNLEILNNNSGLVLPPKFPMNINGTVAGLYLRKNQPKRALPYVLAGLKMIEEYPEIEYYASELYRSASLVYYMLGDTEKGFRHNTKMAEVLAKRFSEEAAKTTAELEVRYETAMKENEILRLQAAKEEADLKATLAEIEQIKKERALYVVIVLAVFAVIAAVVIYRWNRMKWRTQEEQKLSNAIFLSEQNERVRIARDLHDSIGQKLAVQKMLLSQIADEMAAAGNTEMARPVGLLDETIREVRNISHNLIPHELTFGLVRAIVDTAERINEAGAVHVEVDSTSAGNHVPVDHQLSIYRITQEILHNMLEHAGATKIRIKVAELNDRFELLINDNGRGMTSEKIHHSQGIGWKNIMARTRLISGSLRIDSAGGRGTSIQLMVPIVA